MDINNYLIITSSIILGLFLIFSFKINIGKIVKLIFNSILGGILIYFINTMGIIHIGLNAANSLFIGVCGLPGVILLIIIKMF